MIYSVVIDPRALQDIQAAIDYYDFKSEGLGSYFYQEVEQHFEILAKNPFYQIRYKDYHGLPLKKFPFIVFYFIDEEIKTVFVLSIFNTYINPKKYPK
ncbi:MAG: type II toxin-antitoxin system RelE/ParE family toxin [Flavobacterium sp.]|nr:type II toxin-antitoxin system RelE/ParE family toxin [Flavobacterium sp.]MBP8157350.1 type II toxin-antitoxin system RelE/ParE family toxin [Flavobacterium sp.]